MTLDALMAELRLKKLRVTLNGNGPTPVLNIEPKDQVTPELLDALMQHKGALIGLLNRNGRLSVFDQVRALLDGLPEVTTVEVLAGPLRSIASLMADEDALTRALIRADTIAVLEGRKVRGPATIVDAAIVGLPMRDEEETAGRRLLLADIEPWPDPVDGVALLDEIVATITTYVILPAGAAETIALWIVHCHAVAAFDLSPYLAITSPERRCGKTTTLALIARLVPRPVPSANITAAALFRAVEKYNPVLLIDEADLFIGDSPELRGILNSGHTRSSAFVVRTVGEDLEAKMFSTFCPKAIALIKALPATIEDRSIVLALSRKKRGEAVERVRLDRLGGLLDPICRRAARWAADHIAAMREADPDVPAEISNDRTVDNWRPLLAIADHAGGVWPATARAAALAVAGIEPEDTGTGVLLLADLRALFVQKGTAALWTKTIIGHLVSLDERPWPAYDHGRPITARQLGELLAPFGARPKMIRVGDEGCRGYVLEQVADAFVRYLAGTEPSLPSSPPLDPQHPQHVKEHEQLERENDPQQ